MLLPLLQLGYLTKMFKKVLKSHFLQHKLTVGAGTPRNLTSFSEELAERSTSWASKNSETDSDMERRLSFATCCDRGRLTWICSPAYGREKHMVQSLLVKE